MQWIRALGLVAALLVAPTLAFAGGASDDTFGDDIIIDDFDDFERPIPEPSSALVMGAGLITAGWVARKRRR